MGQRLIMKKQDQKIVLVTGASSGIGKEIAIGLAKVGEHVIIVCRNLEKGQAALEEIKARSNSKSIDLLIADLSSQVEIRKLAEVINTQYPALHVVINNAGLALTKKTLSADGIEMTLATNYLGPFLLNNLLIDLLKKSAPARIINVSSAIQKWAKLDLNDLQFEHRKYKGLKAYAQSKLLMNIMTFELARRLAATEITVNCVHPGAVKTAIGSSSANTFLLKLLDKAIKFFFISPQKAAKGIVYLATCPMVEKVTGKYFEKGKAVPSSAITYDPVIAKAVCDITDHLLQSVSNRTK